MADALLPVTQPIGIVIDVGSCSQDQRHSKSTRPYSSFNYLPSFSANSTSFIPSPTARRCGHSPVTSSGSSSSSCNGQITTLRATRIPISPETLTSKPITDQLIHKLSISSEPSKEAGLELARSLVKESPIKTSTLLHPVKQLCYSSSAKTRLAGYELIKSICVNQQSISVMEYGTLWEALRRAGLEADTRTRDAQMGALEIWMLESKALWGICGVMEQLLTWASDVIKHSMGVKPFTPLHRSLQIILESNSFVTESQMVELSRVYRIAIERALDEMPARPVDIPANPTPLSTPIEVNESCGESLSGDIPLGYIGPMFFSLLECIQQHQHIIPPDAIPNVMASLCHMIGRPSTRTHADTASADPAMQATCSILADETYHSLAIEALEDFWDPVHGEDDHRIALGAIRVAKGVILKSLSRPNESPGMPSKDKSITSVETDRMMQALSRLPDTWMVRTGGDNILVELVNLIEQVMTQFEYDRTSEIAAFIGHVILGLTGGLDLYWHNRGATYKLSILEHNAAPTPVIAALEKLLRVALKEAVMAPPLNFILLSRAEHLTDNFLHGLIVQLQNAQQLEPSAAAWRWQRNNLMLLAHFASAFKGYPEARTVFFEHLSQLYQPDRDPETFHFEISAEVITTLERLLPEETEEVVIKAAFDICLKELVLSHEQKAMTTRIRDIWMDLTLEDHPSSFRRVLGVKFLILAFNRFAFKSPQSLKVVEEKNDWRQSASGADTAISLYTDIVELAGLDRDEEGNVQGARLQCPEARLVILQWLLRLRAGANHHIFAVGGPLTEVIPLAKLAHRVHGEEEESMQVPLEKEFPLDPSLAKRRKRRIHSRRFAGISTPRRSRTGSTVLDLVIDHTLQMIAPIEPVETPAEPLVTSIESRSPRAIIGPLPRPPLWTLPDRVRADLFVDTGVPSPAMLTFQTNEQSGYWLHVNDYVDTITDILEHDDDWEIVSYVLCHLPLQLANKHFFCGPKVNETIRRLSMAVCKCIKNNELFKRLSRAGSIGIDSDDLQAMLYHTLMVLIAYRNRFSLDESHPDLTAKQILDDIIESFIEGLGSSIVTSKLSLEGLSLIVYARPGDLAKFTPDIVKKLARIFTKPEMATYILEFLLVLGYQNKAWVGIFKPEDYEMVFATALTYIEQHYQSDLPTLPTEHGKDSFSLAQHVFYIAFSIIHTWFLRIKVNERIQFMPFISKRLLAANKGNDEIKPMTIVSLDFLSRYVYGNLDPKVTPSFLYKSVTCPNIPESWKNLRKGWRERHLYEQKNVADVQAWKLGSSIITASVMKQPQGWVRLTSRRPSCHIDMICHLEHDRSSSMRSAPSVRCDPDTVQQGMDVNENLVEALVHDIFNGSKDMEKPDPISGLSWNTHLPQPDNYVLNPSILAPLLTLYPNDPSRRLQKFPDYNKLVGILEAIDWCPVIDTHKVAVLYVAPGQSTQDEILANQHGSPAYARFIKQLGRVVKIRDELEVYTGGLRADRHGDYALAWWDDICQTLFHVATFMPNIDMPGHSSTYWKQMEIGNNAVKIIWNDGGKPFERKTFTGDFNQFNIVIEPHTLMPLAAYQKDFHVHGFFKVLLQSAPDLPRITPAGEFKLVSIDDLPKTVSHFAFIACLFCRAWTETGADGEFKMLLNTSWRQRLTLITRSEKFLSNAEGTDYSFPGLSEGTIV